MAPSPHPPGILALLFAAVLLGGCVTFGPGLTEREWNAGLKALEPGLTRSQVLALLGEPRERREAEPGSGHDREWIYTRPEVTGTRPERVGEHDVLLPNGRDTLSVPDYEDRDIRVIAEYRLGWIGEELAAWERREQR